MSKRPASTCFRLWIVLAAILAGCGPATDSSPLGMGGARGSMTAAVTASDDVAEGPNPSTRLLSAQRAAYVAAAQRNVSSAYDFALPSVSLQTPGANNPGHQFAAKLDAGALHIEPTAHDWNLVMRWTGIGRGDLIASVPEPAEHPELSRNRASYRHGEGLEQYFVNGPLGLEQGFELTRRPAGNGVLTLVLSADGLLPRTTVGSSDIGLYAHDGRLALRYSDLFAHDALGRQLEAWMTVERGAIRLHVDDAIAHYPLSIDPLFSVIQKLVASDGYKYDKFGNAVSLSGDTALVGALQHNSNSKTDAGAAFVYRRNGNTWFFEKKLVASDADTTDQFGVSVSVDGNSALVGAHFDGSTPLANTGAAYVFVRSGNSWTEQQKLVASDGQAQDRLGHSVALSGDTALVSALFDDHDNQIDMDTGSVYVFVRSGNTWSFEQRIVAGDGQAGDEFGYAVALSGDTALIGAHKDDDNGTSSGSAYVFVRTGGVWTLQEKLLATDGNNNDAFGGSVSLHGETAVIGADSESDNGSNAGAAYVFVRSNNAWSQQTKLLASDGASTDRFGYSVAVHGETAVVGARYDNNVFQNAGAAYVFTRSGGLWTEQEKLIPNDVAQQDSFGSAVAVSADAVLVGKTGDDDKGSGAGAAYIMAPVGQPCVKPDDCPSKVCVDGFCCNTACAGSCEACSASKNGAFDGLCLPMPVATDPDGECPVNQLCGVAGVCALADGQTCSKVDDCASGFCVDNVCCASGCTDLCEACAAAKTGGVDGTCSLIPAHTDPDDECNPGAAQSCNGMGVCKLSNGETCTAADQCVSSNCVDAVCCDTACGDKCHACTSALNGGEDGTCGFIKAGLDPDEECAGAVQNCNGKGDCGTNDGYSCIDDGGCINGHCEDEICCDQDCQSTCTGGVLTDRDCSTGMCQVSSKKCGDYVCAEDGQSCLTKCADNDDCVAGFYCDDEKCVESTDLGESCTDDAQCGSLNCFENVCCAAESDCAPYRCGPSGACRETCASSGACLKGNICNASGKCVPATPVVVHDSGCSIGTGRTAWNDLSALWAAIALAAAAAARSSNRS